MTPPTAAHPFGEDAPDAFDASLPLRYAPLFDALRRVFRHEVRGLEHLPPRGPALLVLNHGPFPVDAILLSHVLRAERGRWPRFLGERMIFETPALEARLSKWGVVEGNHYQARRRFEAGDLVAVFPGGAREAWKPRRERRQVRWAGRTGFVRLAFKAGVPIVPIACPRAEDLYVVFNDGLAWGQRLFGDGRNWPLPLVLGLGVLPFPLRLVHHVGAPIRAERRAGETVDAAIERVRSEAEASMLELLSR
ncbi:acyltransferase family protein [Myxococcota bacterium]|nr:acyltransferase family protein [Myxococcota bacterium]